MDKIWSRFRSQVSVPYYLRQARQLIRDRRLVEQIDPQALVVVCGGMARSGSTWQFNVARMILEKLGQDDIGAGWVDELPAFAHHRLVIVKTHRYNRPLAKRSDLVLTSYRDLRDVLASSQRCFGTKPGVLTAQLAVWHFEQWQAIADHVLRYEDLIDRGKATVVAEMADRILAAGDLRCSDPQIRAMLDARKIAEAVESLKPDRGRGERKQGLATTNGLYDNHITDGRYGTWHGQLSDDLVEGLLRKCGRWMRAHGYISGDLPLVVPPSPAAAEKRAA